MLPFDPDHKPTNPEYQYYADLLGWEVDDPRVGDIDPDFLVTFNGNDGTYIWRGTTTQKGKVF
jgi:hypothetical protein